MESEVMRTTSATDTVHLSCTETAKLVRAALKRRFPGTKFSVRSDSYSGGASIDVGYTDGPPSKDVDAVIEQFAGGRFDGMIDLAYDVEHWLLPDGTATVARDPGSVSYARIENPAPPGARRVSFGADYVHAQRRFTDEPALRERILTYVRAHLTTTGTPPYDRAGDVLVADYMWRILCAMDYTRGASEEETIARAFRKAVLREEGES